MYTNIVKPWESDKFYNKNQTHVQVVIKFLANPKPTSSQWKINETIIKTDDNQVDAFQPSELIRIDAFVSQYLLYYQSS